MRMALHTMLKDSGFNISISGKEAQICASNMLESLYTAEKKIGAAVQKNVSALASCTGRRVHYVKRLYQNYNCTSAHYLLIVYILACPKNSASMYVRKPDENGLTHYAEGFRV